MVRQAQKIINKNVELLSKLVTDEIPLIGIEPSAILTFRDEAIDLATPELKQTAKGLAKNTFTIEEFLWREFERGNISKSKFRDEKRSLKLHGHCYQKSFGLVDIVKKVLTIPENYEVETIPSGCCGMAGSFGFEKEHYETSMKIGELVLLPAVRETTEDTMIAASGTSCRHQVHDGANRKALHPVEILFQALV